MPTKKDYAAFIQNVRTTTHSSDSLSKMKVAELKRLALTLGLVDNMAPRVRKPRAPRAAEYVPKPRKPRAPRAADYVPKPRKPRAPRAVVPRAPRAPRAVAPRVRKPKKAVAKYLNLVNNSGFLVDEIN